MLERPNTTNISKETLLDIIRLQTRICQLWLNLGAIMDVATQGARDLTSADGAVLELTQGDEMVYRAAAGKAESQIGLRLKRQGSLSGQCVEGQQILLCRDSESDSRVNADACRRVGLRSMVVAPLMHGDTAVGVLKVLSSEPDAFDDTDIEILNLLTDLLSSFIFYSTEHETGRIFYLSTHDPLTGLANRALFFDHFRQQFAQARRNGKQFGVLYLDMDGLKSINDTYGHRAGDVALKEFSQRLSTASRESDVASRLGGDEFAILMLGLQTESDIENLTRRIRQKLARPLTFGSYTLHIEASMGWAMYPQDGTEVEQLLEVADQAMYREKQRKKQPTQQRDAFS